MIVDVSIGELTKKYETSGKGPGFISAGDKWGDPGGVSYGSYQLETNKGTMQDYLRGGDYFIDKLKGLKVNSQEFKNMWRRLAKEDPEGFELSQFTYLANKPNGYVDGYKHAKTLGWAVDNKAMQAAIYSTVNQSGGWRTGIFNKAGIDSKDSVEEQINKLYDARAAYFRKLKLSPAVKQSIIQNRTVLERKDCLRMLGA